MCSGVVTKLQRQFAVAARDKKRFSILDEQEVLDSAISWLTDRVEALSDADIRHVVGWLEDSMRLEPQGLWEMMGAADGDDVVSPEITENAKLAVETEREVRDERKAAYIVVTVNGRCKRLHKVKGGCWMGREKIFKSSEEFMEIPDKSSFTHVCKVCWPKSLSSREESSSTSSSTSSSNSQSSTSEDSDG